MSSSDGTTATEGSSCAALINPNRVQSIPFLAAATLPSPIAAKPRSPPRPSATEISPSPIPPAKSTRRISKPMASIRAMASSVKIPTGRSPQHILPISTTQASGLSAIRSTTHSPSPLHQIKSATSAASPSQPHQSARSVSTGTRRQKCPASRTPHLRPTTPKLTRILRIQMLPLHPAIRQW